MRLMYKRAVTNVVQHVSHLKACWERLHGYSKVWLQYYDAYFPQQFSGCTTCKHFFTKLTIASLHCCGLTCPSPPAPDTTAPWRDAAARRSLMPTQSVPSSVGRSLRYRRVASWRRVPKGRRRRAGWDQPHPLPLCWPVRWTATLGWP